MARQKEKKLGKATRISAIIASVLVIVPCLAVAVFGILDVAGVFPLLSSPRSYRVTFTSKEVVVFQQYYLRGEPLDVDITPTNYKGTFKGWDINGDKIPDLLPSRVYMTIDAIAIWKDIKN